MGRGGPATIFAYEAGEPMAGGFVAPERRLAFFATVAAPASFTADGWALFEAAVRWAAGR